jgi:hypothetical protein
MTIKVLSLQSVRSSMGLWRKVNPHNCDSSNIDKTLVTDSGRYFVLKIVNEQGRHAFIGIAFNERNDAFDFNVALQEHKRFASCKSHFELNFSVPVNAKEKIAQPQAKFLRLFLHKISV